MNDLSRSLHDHGDERHLSTMSAQARRSQGITYTPWPIVEAMVSWARARGEPCRVVDPGAGSGRFALAAARAFPRAEIVAIENDPASVVALKANVEREGYSRRVRIVEDDYRAVNLPHVDGVTLFIGNPPYVRHHGIEARWKAWYAAVAERMGVPASKLAGLHLHFFLKTGELAKCGDYACFITAAEWLDVNYGSTLRRLLTGPMKCLALDIFPPAYPVFPDTLTTAVIVSFEIGAVTEGVRVGVPKGDADEISLGTGALMDTALLARSNRWSNLLTGVGDPPLDGNSTENCIGDYFRVKRGQVTGANAIWGSEEWASRLPACYLRPTVTRALELIANKPRLTDSCGLRRVIDLPADLGRVSRRDRDTVARFLDWARSKGAHEGYVASHRRAWWSVGLYDPAPILVTYMGRRKPVFVRNTCGARHLNIAHGLYPLSHMAPALLDNIVGWLNENVSRRYGRTYAGGLTKFEPREMERHPMPMLREFA